MHTMEIEGMNEKYVKSNKIKIIVMVYSMNLYLPFSVSSFSYEPHIFNKFRIILLIIAINKVNLKILQNPSIIIVSNFTKKGIEGLNFLNHIVCAVHHLKVTRNKSLIKTARLIKNIVEYF